MRRRAAALHGALNLRYDAAMTEAPTVCRPFYNLFVQIATAFVAAVSGTFFFAVTPGMPALLRTIITLAIVFGAGPLIIYWLTRRRRV
jgi:hypothetical protein